MKCWNVCKTFFNFFLSILIFVKQSQCYIGHMSVNTDKGYCTYQNGILIPVGDYAIDKVKCERIECKPGSIIIRGCGLMGVRQSPWRICELVPGPGYFPDCCPHIIKCTELPRPTLPPSSFLKNATDDQDGVTTSSSDDVLLKEINKRAHDFENSENNSDYT